MTIAIEMYKTEKSTFLIYHSLNVSLHLAPRQQGADIGYWDSFYSFQSV